MNLVIFAALFPLQSAKAVAWVQEWCERAMPVLKEVMDDHSNCSCVHTVPVATSVLLYQLLCLSQLRGYCKTHNGLSKQFPF